MGFNLKDTFALLALLGTLWAVIATSDGRNSVLGGVFFVSSNCVDPVREGAVTVSNNQVIGGAATSFLDFGFPSATVQRGSNVTGIVNGVERVCAPTYTDRDNSAYIYSCADNGTQFCTILLQ